MLKMLNESREEELAKLMLGVGPVDVAKVPGGHCNLQDLQRTASNVDGT